MSTLPNLDAITRDFNEQMRDRTMFGLGKGALWRTIEHYARKARAEGHESARRIDGDRRNVDYFLQRGFFAQRFSWAIPSMLAIQEIAEFADGETILEIGAGMGLWARLLRDSGVKVVATDPYPGTSYSDPQREYVGVYTTVEKLTDEQALVAYPDADVLMLCWPPYQDPMADYALRAFTGSRVVYIGEYLGGCNATDRFFYQLEEWSALQIRQILLPQWAGIHDSLYLCRRAQ